MIDATLRTSEDQFRESSALAVGLAVQPAPLARHGRHGALAACLPCAAPDLGDARKCAGSGTVSRRRPGRLVQPSARQSR